MDPPVGYNQLTPKWSFQKWLMATGCAVHDHTERVQQNVQGRTRIAIRSVA
jgi:hypothetical protein